jgi:hypothetical protein
MKARPPNVPLETYTQYLGDTRGRQVDDSDVLRTASRLRGQHFDNKRQASQRATIIQAVGQRAVTDKHQVVSAVSDNGVSVCFYRSNAVVVLHGSKAGYA